jgi:hypothetical protein
MWQPSFSGARLRRDLKRALERSSVVRITPADMNCAFYLYPSEAAAKAGVKLGGSGFWVAVSFENFGGCMQSLIAMLFTLMAHQSYAPTQKMAECE